MAKRYIATVVDYGETCDGKARVLGSFKTYSDAKDFVNADINAWAERNNDDGCGCDFINMSAWYDNDYSAGCEWNISEVEEN